MIFFHILLILSFFISIYFVFLFFKDIFEQVKSNVENNIKNIKRNLEDNVALEISDDSDRLGYSSNVVVHNFNHYYKVGVLIIEECYFIIIGSMDEYIDVTKYVDNGRCKVIVYADAIIVNNNRVFKFK